jgi:hypothetical protein
MLANLTAVQALLRRGRHQTHFVLLCGLALLTLTAQIVRNSAGVVPIETSLICGADASGLPPTVADDVDDVDDAIEPNAAPTVGDASHASHIATESAPLSLTTVRLAGGRAPPVSIPTHV